MDRLALTTISASAQAEFARHADREQSRFSRRRSRPRRRPAVFHAALAVVAAGSGVDGRRASPPHGCSKRVAAAPWSRRGSFARCVRPARYELTSGISSATESPAQDRPANDSMLAEMTRTAATLRSGAKETVIISDSLSHRTMLASYRACEALRGN